jgi:hypothetical protein
LRSNDLAVQLVRRAYAFLDHATGPHKVLAIDRNESGFLHAQSPRLCMPHPHTVRKQISPGLGLFEPICQHSQIRSHLDVLQRQQLADHLTEAFDLRLQSGGTPDLAVNARGAGKNRPQHCFLERPSRNDSSDGRGDDGWQSPRDSGHGKDLASAGSGEPTAARPDISTDVQERRVLSALIGRKVG